MILCNACVSAKIDRETAAIAEKFGQSSYRRDLKTGYHVGAEIKLYVEKNSPSDERRNILVLGDSITVADCVIFGKASPDSLCGWRRNLAQECGQEEFFFAFDTLAKIGISARQVAQDLDLKGPRFARKVVDGQVMDPGVSAQFVFEKKYEAVLVALGTNDADFASVSAQKDIKASYEKLIRVFRQRMVGTPRIIFVSPLPSCKNERLRKNIPQAIRAIREIVARQPDLGFIDIYSKFESASDPGCLRDGLGVTDLLHPSSGRDTQGKLARAIAQAQVVNGKSAIPGCLPKP